MGTHTGRGGCIRGGSRRGSLGVGTHTGRGGGCIRGGSRRGSLGVGTHTGRGGVHQGWIQKG